MAYIPPHKRNLKDLERPRPTPDSLIPQFKRNVNLRGQKIIYVNDAISRWFAFGLDDHNQLLSTIHLEPVLGEFIGERPLMLVNSCIQNSEQEGTRWLSMAENILPDILSSFENFVTDMKCNNLPEVMKPTLVARFGKIHFRGSPLVSLESVKGNQVTETMLRNLRRSFNTNVHASYIEKIMNEVVPKIGFDFEQKKEIYHVKLSHGKRPTQTISCKCSLKEDEAKLQLNKVEFNQERYMVVDISCLNKNMDLRLMLCTKKILTSLSDEEMSAITSLIESAVIDSNVKGGLRWPINKSSYGFGDNRYSVVGVWHTTSSCYQSRSARLKLRQADRFDFRTTTGEASNEVILKLKGIVSGLEKAEASSLSDMLKEELSLMWDNFLNFEME